MTSWLVNESTLPNSRVSIKFSIEGKGEIIGKEDLLFISGFLGVRQEDSDDGYHKAYYWLDGYWWRNKTRFPDIEFQN